MPTPQKELRAPHYREKNFMSVQNTESENAGNKKLSVAPLIGVESQATKVQSLENKAVELKALEKMADTKTTAELYEKLRELSKSHPDRLLRATARYVLRRDRIEHPKGKTDNGGRWYPSDPEERSLVGHLRRPSRSFPWSYMLGCRTLRHSCELERLESRKGALTMVRLLDKILEKARDRVQGSNTAVKTKADSLGNSQLNA
jgi:hypothetical protein